MTPAHGELAAREAEFAHDWLSFLDGGGRGVRLAPGPGELRFTPPGYAGVADFAMFAITHLACLSARVGTGELTRVERRRLALAR